MMAQLRHEESGGLGGGAAPNLGAGFDFRWRPAVFLLDDEGVVGVAGGLRSRSGAMSEARTWAIVASCPRRSLLGPRVLVGRPA